MGERSGLGARWGRALCASRERVVFGEDSKVVVSRVDGEDKQCRTAWEGGGYSVYREYMENGLIKTDIDL